jgi:aldehyde dehydrogenase (NAD+)
LGGKSPTIIDETANISHTTKKILFGKLSNCGQICISPDYIFCHESKLTEFVESMERELSHAYNNGEEVGKLVNEFHYKRVCHLL